MKINLKKALAVLFAGTMLFTGCNFGTGNGGSGSYDTEKLNPIDYTGNSIQMSEALAIGWNLGNALDASDCGDWAYNEGLKMEYSWLPHKQVTSQALIKAVSAAGFKTIRIPVSWHNHMSKSTSDYKVDSAWMNRVKQLVDWSLAEGLNVIINIHHDNLTEDQIKNNPGFCISEDADIQKKSKAFIGSVWEQICKTFKDYDNRLVFELLNEPRCVGTDWEWGFYSNIGDSKKWNDIITAYEQVALNVIRKSGGYNTSRYVMAPAYAASDSTLSYYKFPEDCVKNCLLLSVHAYTPSYFCLDGEYTDFDAYKNPYSGATAKSEIDGVFNSLNNNYVKKGIGVVIGEASASDKDNLDSRIKWAEYYFAKAKTVKIPVVLWDNEQAVAMGATAGGENHGYFNRVDCTQTWPSMITAMMNATGTTTATVPAVPETPIGPATSVNPETPGDDPVTPSGEIVIFDAATSEKPDVSCEIVTIGGEKFLKYTPVGYSNFDLKTPVSVAGKSAIYATVRAEDNTSDYQIVVKCIDATKGATKEVGMFGMSSDGSYELSITFSPCSTTAKENSLPIVAGSTVTRVMVAVQETKNYSAVKDIPVYIKKIVAR